MEQLERCEHRDKVFLHTLLLDLGDVDVYRCLECEQTIHIYIQPGFNDYLTVEAVVK
jgi:hypothetical protein